MGYKVDESQLAYKLNYHYAMYKGKPIYVFAKNISSAPYEHKYEMWGQWVGSPELPDFRVDISEPTFSAASIQAGYCFDQEGNLGYLQSNAGMLNLTWYMRNKDFNVPGRTSKLLYNCLMGIHDTFDVAVTKVTKTPRKTAWPFHRDFALHRAFGFSDIDIVYKTKAIGTYDPKSGKIKLRNGPTVKLLKRKLDTLIAKT